MSTAATNKKVIAITGASSGIGEETAKQLVKKQSCFMNTFSQILLVSYPLFYKILTSLKYTYL